MSRSGIFINHDGSTEAWDGDNYVPLGSMQGDPSRLPQRTVTAFPPPPELYMVVEEYPALTLDEFISVAEDQREQEARKRAFHKLLGKAAKLAARKPEATS
ncbi:hypothetical protein [Cryobacterium sp. Y82]|uniref:hypothetical protein n=1 Tax=Cryobacterium sp. Y82 TaxID=2045017 RepID=UPI000CE432C0|nr:hypothetical protein [Cryobacterium sp. Y82]